jgi:hypothetical protein
MLYLVPCVAYKLTFSIFFDGQFLYSSQWSVFNNMRPVYTTRKQEPNYHVSYKEYYTFFHWFQYSTHNEQ